MNEGVREESRKERTILKKKSTDEHNTHNPLQQWKVRVVNRRQSAGHFTVTALLMPRK